MKAVILAGGFGTRLRPLTSNVPKPMALVMNIPMLEHVISLLKKHDINEMVMMLYFQPEVIMDHFKDGSKFGVKLSYKVADKDLGTAGCITLVKDFLKDDDFLIMSGDVFTNFNITEAVNFHKKKKAISTIIMTKAADPLRYGIIITEKDGAIVKFLEKPSWGEVFSDTINTGIYVLSPKVFEHLPEDTNYDFSKNLFPDILNKKLPIFGYTCEGYWKDIGTLSEYKQVHEQLLKGDIECDIKGERKGKLGSDVWLGKNVKIAPTAKLKESIVIGNDCVIEDGAELSNVVIGDNCVIGKGAKIVTTIMWNNNKIGAECDIKEVVIGSGNTIKDRAYIGVGAVISDNCVIGMDAIIKPEVKIWPDKMVEDGAVLSSSLVWGERWSSRIFDAYGITALINIEMNPHIGAKIGMAYGMTYPKGSYVLISRDYHRSSLMIERAIMSGILSMGVNIYDFRISPLPVTKYVAKSLKVAGGLHIRKSPYDEKMIDIKFFDAEGMDISLSQEKTIESAFFKEEYRVVDDDKVGALSFAPRALEYYTDGFMKFIDKAKIQAKNFKVVIDYSYSNTVNIFPPILGELNCDVIALNTFWNEKKLTKSAEVFEESLAKLADTVKTLKANAGIMIDAGGQKIFLVDDKGRILREDLGMLAMSKLFLNSNKGKTIAVPVTATGALEEMAGKSGKVLRVATSYRSLFTTANSKKADFVAEEKGGFIFSEFMPAFDGMIATVKFLEMLADYGKPLSALVDELPKFYKSDDDVPLPWDKRGAVMNKLYVSRQAGAETIEGIEYKEDGGRALIIPDNDKPFFHIYAEGKTKAGAKALMEKYKKFLKKTIEKI